MKLRFIEYDSSIYIVIGLTYDTTKDYPDCFVAIPLDKHHKNIYSTLIIGNSVNIPITYANEITDKKKLLMILVLYG